jgi:hypothetical protein
MRFYPKYKKYRKIKPPAKKSASVNSGEKPDSNAFGDKSNGKTIVKTELRAMLPLIVVCDAILLIICLVWAFALPADDLPERWSRLLQSGVGLILGNALFAANFYALGWSADIILAGKKQQKAKSQAQVAYMLRYLALFAVLITALLLKIAALLPLLAPLFFPKIYYFICALRQPAPPGKKPRK